LCPKNAIIWKILMENLKKEFLDYLKVADEVFEVKNSDGVTIRVWVYVA